MEAIFRFNEEENEQELKLIIHRKTILRDLDFLSAYIRKLSEYEEREEIPTEEIVDKLKEIIIDDYYNLLDE